MLTEAASISTCNVDWSGSSASSSNWPLTPGNLARRLATLKCQTLTMTWEWSASIFQEPGRSGGSSPICLTIPAPRSVNSRGSRPAACQRGAEHSASEAQPWTLDNVELVFEGRSPEAIAHEALLLGTGSRALKSIIEELLLNSMFEVPSRPEIRRCIVSEESILESREPELLLADESDHPDQQSTWMSAAGTPWRKVWAD